MKLGADHPDTLTSMGNLASTYKNQGRWEEAEKLFLRIYVSSFAFSQKDMLESAYRVTGTTSDDWSITKEPVKDGYASGVEGMAKGIREDFAKMLYARIFFSD
ncbi:hypothetical protein B0I35DRAFT_484219 [Stachybotrys elegans]|uniref:Kinesin light chain n=1 Tax=Stachybotrys elegans TaxID=80388 RepID=A0A8K0WKR4_9HYPO|nr:hypothetical protein B0I35DRAFT_484219 [Stachybotrys elegans]